MRLKRSNPGARACAVASFVVLSALALTVAPALALPEGRVYEMVSPPYKGGYAANEIVAVAPDGESVAFLSLGAFAGAPSSSALNIYIARREASGWSSPPLIAPQMPPATVAPEGATVRFSANLESTLFHGSPGPNNGEAEATGTVNEFLLHSTATPDTAANWNVAGMPLEALNKKPFVLGFDDVSADFSHILLVSSGHQMPAPLLPLAENTKGQVYDLATGSAGEEPSLRLVGLNNSGQVIDPYCEVDIAAAAVDGVIVFRASAHRSLQGSVCDEEGPGVSNPANPKILYARLGGERTVQISAPIEADCAKSALCHSASQARAEFKRASEDESRIFFTTTQPLVTEDTDKASDLYMAELGCPGGEGEVCEPAQRTVSALVQVSHDANAGQAAEVQRVVAVAPDGSRAYFVARGVLSEGSNAEGNTPVQGAENLYVYERDERHPAGHVAFVADLCSGAGLSGAVEDLRCPPDLDSERRNDTGGELTPQTAGRDGGFLLFGSYGQLVASDTDTARDVYRYDAASGTLERISHGEAAYHSNGNDSEFNAAIPNVPNPQVTGARTSSISEDGSRVVFTTAEPLSPGATNGLSNAYEWHQEPGEQGEGKVSLLSGGNADEPVEEVVITPRGRDIFFVTDQGLVPQDTDGAKDVYDARLEGGFPLPPAPVEPCEGDACQGPLTNPAALLLPGSVSQAPGGSFAAPAPVKAAVKPKAKPKAKSCKKGFVQKKRKCVKKPKKSAKGKK